MNLKSNSTDLINVYKQTKVDEGNFIDTQSIFWDKRFKENNKFYNPDNLINFRKNQVLSEGLDDAPNLKNKFNLLQALDNFETDFLRKNLPEKNIGNCHHSVNFLGYWFDYGIIHHLKWYEKIQEYIKDDFFVLEIGGGFGSLSRIILKNKNVKYFMIDLPEANLITNYYLQSNFPEKKIFNYSNYKKSKLEESIKDFDIFILPPRILDKKDIKYDFIINTRSFMEMNKKIIQEYFDLIHNKIKKNGYFLNINRYMKSKVNEDIKFDEYPYDNLWNVEISEKSYLQNHVHFLLTKRQSDKGNIANELLVLKNSNYKWKSPLLEKLKNIYSYTRKGVWLIIKSILTLLFSKKKLKKLSSIIYNISEVD